jgi:hypothetical protein
MWESTMARIDDEADRWKDTCLMPQEELKVYIEGGYIALKQIAANGEEALLYVTPGNVPALVARLLELYQATTE